MQHLKKLKKGKNKLSVFTTPKNACFQTKIRLNSVVNCSVFWFFQRCQINGKFSAKTINKTLFFIIFLT